MVHELVRIVEEAEKLLSTPPANLIPLDKLRYSDVGLLAEFLRQERDAEPHYQRYKDWSPLIGEPLMCSNPKKYIRKKKQEAFKIFAKLGELGLLGVLIPT